MLRKQIVSSLCGTRVPVREQVEERGSGCGASNRGIEVQEFRKSFSRQTTHELRFERRQIRGKLFQTKETAEARALFWEGGKENGLKATSMTAPQESKHNAKCFDS